jgi:hypothetical protein
MKQLETIVKPLERHDLIEEDWHCGNPEMSNRQRVYLFFFDKFIDSKTTEMFYPIEVRRGSGIKYRSLGLLNYLANKKKGGILKRTENKFSRPLFYLATRPNTVNLSQLDVLSQLIFSEIVKRPGVTDRNIKDLTGCKLFNIDGAVDELAKCGLVCGMNTKGRGIELFFKPAGVTLYYTLMEQHNPLIMSEIA